MVRSMDSICLEIFINISVPFLDIFMNQTELPISAALSSSLNIPSFDILRVEINNEYTYILHVYYYY